MPGQRVRGKEKHQDIPPPGAGPEPGDCLMGNRRFIRMLTLCLAGLLLIGTTGCSSMGQLMDRVAGEHTPQPTPTPSDNLAFEAVEFAVPPQTVPFSQMVYVRPEIEAMAQQIAELAGQINDGTTEEQALALMGSAQNIYNDFSTAETLAMIHNSMDYTDEYWREQYSHCLSNKPVIQQAMTAFNQALASSAVGRAAGLTPSRELYQYEAVLPLLQYQTQLVNEYEIQLATNTATFSGETYTLAESVSDEMTENWIAQNAAALGELYLQLVRTRNQMAAACGYNNYIEFIYAVDEKDYTPGEVASLLDRIAGSLGPIYAEMQERGIYAIDLRISQEELFEDLRRIFLRLDPQLEAALQFMRNYDLYDFALGPNKPASDYATYIVNYAAPFLMVAFDGSWSSLSSVVNEFGHFYNYTVNPEASYSDLDTQEIFSLALELMTANKYGECFADDDAYMLLYNALAAAYAIFPYQGYLTGFESEVYTLEDSQLTFETLCDVSERQWNRFGLGAGSPVARTDWVTTLHIFENPFYPVSYLTSADVAMQLWERSLTDPKDAMDKYMELMQGSKDGKAFLTNVRDVGLVSPFDPNEMANQSVFFRNFLIYETGTEGAAAQPTFAPAFTATPAPDASPTPLPDFLNPGQQMQGSPTPRPTRNRYHALDHRWGMPRPTPMTTASSPA